MPPPLGRSAPIVQWADLDGLSDLVPTLAGNSLEHALPRYGDNSIIFSCAVVYFVVVIVVSTFYERMFFWSPLCPSPRARVPGHDTIDAVAQMCARTPVRRVHMPPPLRAPAFVGATARPVAGAALGNTSTPTYTTNSTSTNTAMTLPSSVMPINMAMLRTAGGVPSDGVSQARQQWSALPLSLGYMTDPQHDVYLTLPMYLE